MTYLDLTLTHLAANLALDEAFLLKAEAGQGGELLRFWEWPAQAVVLGAGCKLSEDVDESACLAAGVPLARRSSGGGTVLLGPGCLLYTLILSYQRSPLLTEIKPSHHYILTQIQGGLTSLDPSIEPAGTSDLAIAGRKFSGNSQQRKKNFLLHHGTILYAFDIGSVGKLLHHPSRQPAYRLARPHHAFLTNLASKPDRLKQCFREMWQAYTTTETWPADLVERLVSEKYGRDEWVKRR